MLHSFGPNLDSRVWWSSRRQKRGREKERGTVGLASHLCQVARHVSPSGSNLDFCACCKESHRICSQALQAFDRDYTTSWFFFSKRAVRFGSAPYAAVNLDFWSTHKKRPAVLPAVPIPFCSALGFSPTLSVLTCCCVHGWFATVNAFRAPFGSYPKEQAWPVIQSQEGKGRFRPQPVQASG